MADFASEHFAREMKDYEMLLSKEHIMRHPYGVTAFKCCDDGVLEVKPYAEDQGKITLFQFYCSACTQIKLIVSDEVYMRMEEMR